VGDAGVYGGENVFVPAALTVTVGSTVTWVWRGAGHTLQSGDGCAPDGRFTSNGVQAPGYQMSYTFTAAGTYPYYCSTHCGQLMKGTVTVQ
jgi:plastocyanin